METQRRIINFVRRANWIIFVLATVAGFLWFSGKFAFGVMAGGLIVTLNFHMLSKTLRKAFSSPRFSSWHVILVKYYIRFIISGIIIFALILTRLVSPVGLIIGLSIVVASIMLATLCEVKKIIFKEAI
ncbi:ATP synthase subunit I [Candidatus Desulfarcum epimagneticum]|uniref:ATP synthase subunit I n=1 Tax=uncultured Desulfobacteraceae bacterium TaxID=218296 RepID=A0A484HKJ6_9BACT|nr:ATP synthase subunit I [uncultured Desulfobacteraceae bacterium]